MDKIADKEIIAVDDERGHEIEWTAKDMWELATPYLLFIGLSAFVAILYLYA